MISVIMQDGTTADGSAGGAEQIFAFTPPSGRELVFFVPRLVALRKEHPDQWHTLDIPLDAEAATIIFGRGGINQRRLRQVARTTLTHPGYGVFLDDGSFLVVDGNHRFFARWQRGFDVMKFHVAWAPDSHPALIDMAATSRPSGGK